MSAGLEVGTTCCRFDRKLEMQDDEGVVVVSLLVWANGRSKGLGSDPLLQANKVPSILLHVASFGGC